MLTEQDRKDLVEVLDFVGSLSTIDLLPLAEVIVGQQIKVPELGRRLETIKQKLEE